MKFKLEPNFSDSIDRVCKNCGQLSSDCVCLKDIKILDNDLYVIKFRVLKVKNKVVSIIYPFYTKDIKNILSFLKKKFACGGSIKRVEDYYEILLQGNFGDKESNTIAKNTLDSTPKVLEELHLKFGFKLSD
ncbi:hypothetical protein [Helicobacter sp. MIT 14-3879]|uniref:hypothetical protein n=1 Tax=Helicobacter sp. MIT 14-3879 TaxID=2040649 RepID=UPI000E1F18D7|nr:hypothetical protein [Helicobacter sp. MIT 14-3879]RDU62635.1 hypothetical protein CQA44_06520 [Helicobacter sp. MIT 14-3879]